MKQNNNNKTTFLCPLSSTWPQELPIRPAWLPESDSCHLISTITSSKEGEEMFVLTEGSLMRCVELRKTPSVLTDRPSRILSTIWGDYVFHSCVKLTEKDPQWNVLWRRPMLVCGPPCGTLGWRSNQDEWSDQRASAQQQEKKEFREGRSGGRWNLGRLPGWGVITWSIQTGRKN